MVILSGLSASDLWSSCGRSSCAISAGAVVAVVRAVVSAGFEFVVDVVYAVVTAGFDVCAEVVAVVVCVVEICDSGTDFSVVTEVLTAIAEVV